VLFDSVSLRASQRAWTGYTAIIIDGHLSVGQVSVGTGQREFGDGGAMEKKRRVEARIPDYYPQAAVYILDATSRLRDFPARERLDSPQQRMSD
jgi:hypothetical protein